MSFSSYTLNNIINPQTGNAYVVPVRTENTTSDLFNTYVANINGIKADLLAASQSGTSGSPASLTPTQIADIKNKLGELWTTTLNGDGNGNYYTSDMVSNLNMLFLSLKMVGIDATNVNATTATSTYNKCSSLLKLPLITLSKL
jgi:hypothetical protein